MYLLGYDIGTSSVKAALVDAQTGQTVASAQYPDSEAPILARQAGWAEQEPQMWWDELRQATLRLAGQMKERAVGGAATQTKGAPAAGESGAEGIDPARPLAQVAAIGISYQMHGLVCVDKAGEPLRPAIIWCDGRAVPYGQRAFEQIGGERCLSHLLNSPGNFTAAKLAWVKEQEPEVFAKIAKIMLPGDYIAMRLSGGVCQTTVSGLSEGMFWDFQRGEVSRDVMECFGFPDSLIPDIVPTFSVQSRVCEAVAQELGIPVGTPIAYRGGDQPNNALSLNVMRPGEIAATGGTSGVVYGVLGEVNYDPQSRVNTFAHVNHLQAGPDGKPQTRLGVLLCINGTGIQNAWMRRTVAPEGISYPEMNELAETVPVGCEGLTVIPFGNGAERVLGNANPGASIHGINFNIHTKAHLVRAAHEGIAFSFAYGIDIMRQMGMDIRTIKAAHANMFLNTTFCRTLATVTGATIELYETDGSVGAAYGGGLGAGIYADADEAFRTLKHKGTVRPAEDAAAYRTAYERWLQYLPRA